jgi:signal transduction histidine kinase
MAIVGDAPQRLQEAVSLAVYRIVQESLTNARRHAPGSTVQVTLAFRQDRVGVTVENGEGTPEATNGHGPGVGILGMRERAAAVGGSVNARALAHGFRVEAGLPYGGP